MSKCQSCGAEDFPIKRISLETAPMDVCLRCYASIEKEYYERLKREQCLKRKRSLML